MGGNGGVGRAGVAATKNMLQSIREIVGGNFPDDEIHAMLKECNMDPSETVHRLLNQDTFHEVRSKREKKKDTKDSGEFRSRGVNNISNRVGRGVADYSGRVGSNQVSSSECVGNRIKPLQKKENGPNAITNSSVLGCGAGESGIIKSSTPVSDSVVMENGKGLLTAIGDTISSQYSPGIQTPWSGVPGQRTLADIVKMGRPPSKTSRVSVTQPESFTSHTIVTSKNLHASTDGSVFMVPSSDSHHEDSITNVLDLVHEPGASVGPHASHDEWPLVDQSPAGSPSLLEAHDTSAVYTDQAQSSNVLVDGVSFHCNSGLDNMHIVEGNVEGDNAPEDFVRPIAASDRHIQGDHPVEESGMDGGPAQNKNSCQPQLHGFEHHEGNDASVDVSSTASGLQQLNFHEVATVTQADGNPAVIFPNNLQITNPDCSHLSFGSFGSAISASFSGSFASSTQKCNVEVPSETANATSVDHSDSRNSEYCGNEQLRHVSNEDADSRPSTDAESYDIPSSHPDVIGADSSDSTEGLQYRFQSSVSGYTFSNATQPNAASYASIQENSQTQNLAPFSAIVQSHTDSSPINLLAPTIQPTREYDLRYSSLLAAQPTSTKYSTSVSSTNVPSISMLEVVKPDGFCTHQPTQQNLSATNPSGPTVPQHIPVQSYSQPTLPLGHFANIIGYPFLPQSYTYLPSAAFPQAYSSNSVYNQSPAAVNAGIKYTSPQFKTSAAVSNLPQAAAVPTGFGGLGSSTNILGNFVLNPSTSSTSTTGYDNILDSQYKDGNHHLPLQQNETSPLWLHGVGSRTMSSLPARTYYSFQGQNQLSGFRQSQQPSPYGASGYPNFFHSQASVTQEHQQLTLDGSLNASRGPVSQMANQLWQHNF
uniref:GBF-interacting protein 1 N-terminal domain-containing protein n=1 Tax=Anthurium amnicola TaxID=1678845 RepID=A0A1D1ZID3_9ARAE